MASKKTEKTELIELCVPCDNFGPEKVIIVKEPSVEIGRAHV